MPKKEIIALSKENANKQKKEIENYLKGNKPKTQEKSERKSPLDKIILQIQHLKSEDFTSLCDAIDLNRYTPQLCCGWDKAFQLQPHKSMES